MYVVLFYYSLLHANNERSFISIFQTKFEEKKKRREFKAAYRAPRSS